MKKPKLSLRALYDLQEGHAAGVRQDIDSIKHVVRGIQWRVDAIVNHFRISVQPDALEPILNPSPASINAAIMSARFADGSKKKRVVKRKRRPKKKA